MKKLLLTLALFAAPVFAEPATEDDKFNMCLTLAEFADKVMDNRQSGVELPNQLAVIKGAPPDMMPIMKTVIMLAYDSPRYNTESNKADEVKRYKEKVLLTCLKTMK